MKRTTTALMLLVAGTLFVGGCVASIGNKEGRYSGGTVGQQLIDLQKAKDAGAISETEYAEQREKLLNR
jgi:hypothetical protein